MSAKFMSEEDPEVYLLGAVMNILDGWFPNAKPEIIYAAASDIVSEIFIERS